MEETKTHCFAYICSRNPIAMWVIDNLITSKLANWRLGRWLPKQRLDLPDGLHVLVIDAFSISEWPEVIRKWSCAGHRTILLVAESWWPENGDLHALHLGVRGIVHLSRQFMQDLETAITIVAQGQLFAREAILDEFYDGPRRREPSSNGPCLSFREKQVKQLIMTGLSNRKIGTVLGISERTAKFHVCNILKKLQMPNRRGLISNEESAQAYAVSTSSDAGRKEAVLIRTVY